MASSGSTSRRGRLIFDFRCPMCSGLLELEFEAWCDDRCALLLETEAPSVSCCRWWLMRFFFFFRLGFLFQFLLYSMNRQTSILGFGFFFSWEFMDLLPSIICWVYFSLFFFFRLDLIYHLLFRIDVGLFFP